MLDFEDVKYPSDLPAEWAGIQHIQFWKFLHGLPQMHLLHEPEPWYSRPPAGFPELDIIQ